MGTNVELMKKKLQKINDKEKGKSDNGNRQKWFKMENGEKKCEVRFLPTPDGDPFKELFFHYIPNPETKKKTTILCPKRNFGENCPICEFVKKLYDDGTDESKVQAKALQVAQRFMSAVLVRGKEEVGPHLWTYSKTIYKYLLEKVLDPEYGDICDPTSGTDMVVSPEQGPMYMTYKVEAKRRPSKLAKTEDEIEEILSKVPDLNEVQKRNSYEEVEEIFNKYMDSLTSEPKDPKEVAEDKIDEAVEELL